MTFGELRAVIRKQAPATDLTLIDHWIARRYEAILDRLNWRRLREERVVQTVAEHAAGTVAVTNSNTAIAGTGTGWTAGMSGRKLRIAGQTAWYTFTYVSAVSGTLDRPYEEATGSGLGYKINQNVFPLAADVRVVHAVRGELGELHQDESAIDAGRIVYGAPVVWRAAFDAATNPPVVQLEVYPLPVEVEALRIDVTAEEALSGQTSQALLPWVRTAALEEGVMANVRRAENNLGAAREHEAAYERALEQMVATAASQAGPQRLTVDPYFTRHRANRWLR